MLKFGAVRGGKSRQTTLKLYRFCMSRFFVRRVIAGCESVSVLGHTDTPLFSPGATGISPAPRGDGPPDPPNKEGTSSSSSSSRCSAMHLIAIALAMAGQDNQQPAIKP